MKFSHKWTTSWRKVLPPVFTLTASAAILAGSFWYYQNEQQQNHATTGENVPTTVGNDSRASQPQFTATNTSANHTTNPSRSSDKGKDKGSGATNSTKPAQGNPSTSNQTPDTSKNTTPATEGNIGFSPVSGGSVSSSLDPVGGVTQPFASVMTQFGANPITNFNIDEIRTQFNVDVVLDKSLTRSPSQLVAIPLSKGVLWAVVAGEAQQAAKGTPLYYTPYGLTNNPSEVVLSPSQTQPLGTIPVQTANVAKLGSSWYNPGHKPQSSNQNNTTANAAAVVQGPVNMGQPGDNSSSNGNSSSGTPNDASTQSTAAVYIKHPGTYSISTATGAQIQLIDDSASTSQLYLSGLYQVNGGAVVTLLAQSNSGNSLLAYYWNENNESLIPICTVQNTNLSRGWVAVGTQTVYWGQRTLIPPAQQYYKGSQYMTNLSTDKTYGIKLGTWVDTGSVWAGKSLSAPADGPANEDSLYFKAGDTSQWMAFIPNPH